MKFSKYLEGQSIPEWRKAYINYKGLKKKLKQVERASFLNVGIKRCNINCVLQFRRAKERKAAIHLDNAFQDMDDSDDSYYWYNKSEYGKPQSIMSKISSRFNHRPVSRQGTYHRNRLSHPVNSNLFLFTSLLFEELVYYYVYFG